MYIYIYIYVLLFGYSCKNCLSIWQSINSDEWFRTGQADIAVLVVPAAEELEQEKACDPQRSHGNIGVSIAMGGYPTEINDDWGYLHFRKCTENHPNGVGLQEFEDMGV